MGRKKKQFIDKKNSQTFHLVHRSQRDPLQADEDSSKYVLHEVETGKEKDEDLARREKQAKYGIYFDDEYDYTQHLREVNTEQVLEAVPAASTDKKNERKVHFNEDVEKKGRVQLPPEVLPSLYEEDVGLLNKAAPISGPRLDLDPDLVAVMDEDFDFDDPDNQLDDDFILQAQADRPYHENGMPSDDKNSEDGDYVDSDGPYGSDEGEVGYDDDHMTIDSEGNRSRFTEYSISSSVMHRNKGLSLLDDRFEKLFEQYDDMELGALEQDEIEGYRGENSEVLNQVLTEFEASQKKITFPEAEANKKNSQEDEDSEETDDDDQDVLIKMQFEEPVKEKWDCESILSTYSNIYNHPKIIDEPRKMKKKVNDNSNESSPIQSDGPIRLSQKTGMPLNVLPQSGPTKKQLERQEYDETRLPVMVEPRKKGQKETLDQKKERKMDIKTDRRERRMEKKANKTAFKEEQKRQEKAILNVQKNMQGVKIS